MAPSRPPRPPTRPARDPKELLKKRGADLIRKVSDKDRYGIFLEPVDVDQVTGYADVISRPMDLSTAQSNLQMGVYRTPMELRADLDLIWSNCCTFNADDSIYFKEAARLRALAARYYDDLVRLLGKDGVAPALGLSNSRQNGPSAARASQKRPPRHRPSSQTSDLPMRMTSPSLQTSNSMDVDEESNSASASPSAGNLNSFRDAHLRRARVNLDAAIAEASAIASEVKAAANSAGLANASASDGKNLLRGPADILVKQRNADHVSLPPRQFPIMSNSRLRDSCAEIPIAWRRIGRWHSRAMSASKFLTASRALDVRYGRCFQKQVKRSAPMARRLLATLLDPSAVRDYDLLKISEYRRIIPSSVDERVQKTCKEGMDKQIHDSDSTTLTNGEVKILQKNGRNDPMDLDTCTGTDDGANDIKRDRQPKRPRANPHPGITNRNGTQELYAANLLREVLGAERAAKFSLQRIGELEASSKSMLPKNAIYRLRALLKSRGMDASFLNRLTPFDQAGEHEQIREKARTPIDAEFQAHHRKLSHLLSSNHATMLNILRLRALRENADESALENLEDRERECAERLADGMSLAVRHLPPRFVVHPVDAAESAAAIARTISSREPSSEE